jgi:hypothetical protein
MNFIFPPESYQIIILDGGAGTYVLGKGRMESAICL